MLPFLFLTTCLTDVEAKSHKKKKTKTNFSSSAPYLTAQSYVIVDAKNGEILHGRLPHKKLPPASTTKVMTVLIALECLPLQHPVEVSANASNASPSKAGLKPGVRYRAGDLVAACLISSSNDAAVALAEAVSGTEYKFSMLMNEKVKEFGMENTQFANATGLPDKNNKQYTTAYDLTKLMRRAVKNKYVDELMGLSETSIKGSDGQWIQLRAHNKMLWKKPGFVKGKTGWTYASRHTFVGTDYAPEKSIAFAMLSSKKPWADIERLATFGSILARKR